MGAREARAKRELRIVEAFGRPLSDAGSIPAAFIVERGPHTGEGLFLFAHMKETLRNRQESRIHYGKKNANHSTNEKCRNRQEESIQRYG